MSHKESDDDETIDNSDENNEVNQSHHPEHLKKQSKINKESTNLSNLFAIVVGIFSVIFILFVGSIIYYVLFSDHEQQKPKDETVPPANSVPETSQTPPHPEEKQEKIEENVPKSTPVTQATTETDAQKTAASTTEENQPVVVEEPVITIPEETNWSTIGNQLISLEEQRQQTIKLMTEQLEISQ